jgi:nucleoside-diphosphate-sugar epimerase
MKKVLVLGGTRFFGKRLVQKLINRGYDVSIATRGISEDHFGPKVNRFVIDRKKPETLNVLSGHVWDLVYDNICYTPIEAKEIIRVLTNSVKKYIFTSSLAVYEEGLNHKEEDFNPFIYPVKYEKLAEFSYAEGKRLSEAVLFQEATFPVVAARFPVVLGSDDYTKRLLFHVNKISNGEEIVISDLNKEMTFIDSDETAEFLLWLGENDSIKNGPINACSNGVITFKEIIRICENEVGKQAIIISNGLKEDESPFDAYSDQSLSNEKAKIEGFHFLDVHEWMKSLIHTFAHIKKVH